MSSKSSHPRTAIYTGSFDPITLGHLNVIQRSAKLVDRLIVGIAIHNSKNTMFTIDERVELVREVTGDMPNVEVQKFSGLAVNFVRSQEAKVMIRGVRPLTDIAAEFTMMMANRHLDPEIETVFLMSDEEFSHVSSSLIKQIAPLASDRELSAFVPPEVIEKLRQKMGREEA